MSAVPIADSALARRIEAAIVRDVLGYVDSSRASGIYPDASTLRVGGGLAVWFSPGNVVNGAFGIGMDRQVEKEEVAALIAFFAERGAPARVDVCPHADRSLLRWLAEAGFLATDFEMVLYQPLPVATAASPARGVEVRVASTAAERAVWADLEANGFTDGQPTEDHVVLAQAIAGRHESRQFIGYLDGEPVGTGMLSFSEGVALFTGDSTLPHARGRGVQTSILAERLRYASVHGCDLAVIEAAAGGTSQRNQERAGFRVAYNRVTLEQPLPR